MMRTLLICSLFVVTGCQTASFNSQVIKAHEMEAKTTLGSWTRFQQSYHLEKDRFATSNSELDFSVASSEYYDFNIRDVTPEGALMTANPKKKYEQLSSYFGLAAYDNGEYSSGVCKLEKPFTSYDNFYDIEIEDCDGY